jgi:hypothetical protein
MVAALHRREVHLVLVQCAPTGNMDVPGELHAVADKLSPYDDRPTCECCGQGRLELIDERPDPIFGVLV